MLKNPRGTATFISILSLMLLTTVLIGYGASMRGTQALLTDTEVSTGNTFTAGTWETDVVSLSPGTSKATYVYEPGPFPLIAGFDENGQLQLDFGGIRAGNSNHSPDVFRIKNLSATPETITFTLSDNLIPLFSSIQLEGGNILDPGQEKKVEMKLDTSPSTPAGLYTGSLTIDPGEGHVKKVIPVQVLIS